MVARFRAQGKTVGVLAVDPTSPFSGGAILGDRIRMQDHASDPGVFIRSLATRGSLGGLSRATGDCIRVMDAMGKDVIVVETVGVGQDEIDIAQMAHTTVLVTVPGMGDDIQAIKAGILEVADVFVVNKADLDGADRTVRELRQMLELRHALRARRRTTTPHHRLRARAAGQARPRLLRPTPTSGSHPSSRSIAARTRASTRLMEAIAQHLSFLERTGQKAERERARARTQFLALLRNRLLRSALDRLEAREGPARRGGARHRPPRGGPVRPGRDPGPPARHLNDARAHPPPGRPCWSKASARGWASTRWTRCRAWPR